MNFIRRKFRYLHRRLIDRIELVKVHGWLARLVRDPDKMTRWAGGIMLPLSISFVMRSWFYMNGRIETEMLERETRREIHATRRLRLGPADDSPAESEGKNLK